jgi:hypothetical protein
MNSEMAELRKLLDLFEEAGFTMTDYYNNEQNTKMKITIRHDTTNSIKTGEIVSLFETNAYRVLDYGIIEDMQGTVCVTVIPEQPFKAK